MGDDEMISVFNPPKLITTNQKIRHIANYYGFESQSRQLMEECGELTQAVNKVWRLSIDGKETPDYVGAEIKLIEEMADVLIMIEQMKEILDITQSEIKAKMKVKLDREMSRIKTKKKLEAMTYQ